MAIKIKIVHIVQSLKTRTDCILPPASAKRIDIWIKDFKDLSEIQGFQGFFQGCGHPASVWQKQL